MKKLTTKKFIEELEGTIDIKARKNYFIVEEKGNKIRIIDQKGNDIFTFEGSFCWNPKETVLICNDNWVITKKNEYGYYYLYDCINKTIVEIRNKLSVGDELEILVPGKLEPVKFTIEKLWDIETDEEIQTVNPGKQGQQVKMKLPIKVEENWIIRRKK